MKTTKRLLSCLLVLAMLFALAIPAFAADSGKVIVKNTEKDVTYGLYRLFDVQKDTVTESGESKTIYSYTVAKGVNSKIFEQEDCPFEIVAGHVQEKENVDDVGLAEWLQKNIGSFVSVESKASNGVDVEFTGLSDGYYVVSRMDGDSPAATAKVGSNTLGNAEVVIFDKNTKDEPVTPPDGKDRYKTLAGGKVTDSVDLGGSVKFDVSFNAKNYTLNPDYEEGKDAPMYVPITSYVVTDTPTGMTIAATKENVTVKVNGTELSDDDYTVDKDENNNIVVSIPWNDGNHSYAVNGATVVITYTGTVDDKDAKNEAVVSPQYEGKKPDEGDKTDKDPVQVKSTDFQIFKTDKENNALQGAEFMLSKVVTEDDAEKTLYYKITETDGKNVVTWEEKAAAATKITDENGLTSFAGLGEGTYQLEETKAPDGYNALDEAITLTIVSNGKDDKDYALIVKNGDKELAKTNGGIYQIQIENDRGTVLPSTGGIGTTMFYVVGGLLVAAAVVVLVSKKRMGAEQ